MEHALFTATGDGGFVPTDYGRGPWDPGHMHGGPVGALLARAVEGVPDGGEPLEVSRMTIEILRPVPLEPLVVTASVLRPGRKVQLVEATLTHAGTGVTRFSATTAYSLKVVTQPAFTFRPLQE